MDGKKFETLVRWYLRFNGYFTVDNFILHDPSTVSKGHVANHTEADILGLRLPHSREIAGNLSIANDPKLQIDGLNKIDFVIAECKSGKSNSLNSTWLNGNRVVINYILRFSGLFASESDI